MKILHIDCSPREESHSRKLSAALVVKLKTQHPQAAVVQRDLGRNPIPHACGGYAAVLSSPGALTAEQTSEATTLSEELIKEVEAADAVVIGTPMNNFAVPSVFKAWLDQILRMGRTIGENAMGQKVGLLRDKPVYIGIASGGVFMGERARQPDFMTPYLNAAFGCIGLTSLQFFALQATAFRSAEELETECQELVKNLRVE